jgi:DNA ligase (NAD+)
MKTIKQLVAEIENHDELYNRGESEISDQEYDSLIMQLRELDPKHPLVNKINIVKVASEGKVKHLRPMLSLAKAYSLDEVMSWAKKVSRSDDEMFLIQPKYDGISANYDGAVLSTRGDGEEGENISSKIPLIVFRSNLENLPVRGEIVISKDIFVERFSKVSRAGGQAYKNSRNAVAGIMGLKDIREIQSSMKRANAFLEFVEYGIWSEQYALSNLEKAWNDVAEDMAENSEYPLDGLVVKLKDEAYSESLGNTSHHPRGQIAFKFANVRKESPIVHVEWSFGKNCLTPVAEIEPVDIGGITITHASLHNYKNVISKDIFIGDIAIIERAGDVIPYIAGTRPGKDRKDFMIDVCPCCSGSLVVRGVELCCPNKFCFEVVLKRLSASVKSIGIEYLGEPTLRKLMKRQNVMSLKALFNLSLQNILDVPGFQPKSAQNLIEQINKARKISDCQLIASLNIEGIGITMSKKLLSHYTAQELRECDVQDLLRIDGIGEERAKILIAGLRENSDIIDDICEAIEVTQTKGQAASNLPTICFTGKMPEKRSYYEELAKSRGYQAVDSVTKELTLLVANDVSESGGKLDKARKLKIEIQELNSWMGK